MEESKPVDGIEVPTPRRKNTTYVITLVTRKQRQSVGFDAAYDKNEHRIQKIVDNAVKAKHYYLDANPNYQKVSYLRKHLYFRDKSHTFTVESVNSDIRKYIAALQRKSKCSFRSLETFQAVIRVCVHAYNKFGEVKQRFPRL